MPLFNNDPMKQYAKSGKKYVKEQQKINEQEEQAEYRLQIKEEQMKQSKEKLTQRLSRYGFDDPTQTTLTAISRNDVWAGWERTANILNMFTLDTTKQMLHNFFTTEMSQNFVSQIQNDKIIKQNEKIIDQNEQIIELLTKIADK